MSALSVESMPYLIAQDLGFYKKHNISLDRRNMKVDIGVMAAVSGQVDVTQILGLSLRGAIERGADLRIVMVFNELPTYSLFVRKPISSIAELKGQKVASSTNGASATRVLRAALESAGLDPDKDVNIFYIGDTPTRFQSVLSGAVAGAVLISPFDVAALKEPTLAALPFANSPGVLMAGAAAHVKFLKERPDVAKRFIQATQEGLRYFRSNKAESIKLMVKHLKIDEDAATKTYDRWIDRFTADGAISDDFVRKVLEFEFGKASPDMVEKAFDFSIVKSLSKN
jgi:ABC-type nitrate/sulfonate/bicarbonate transport system substrate-binding protein